jgi:hypothetical protein
MRTSRPTRSGTHGHRVASFTGAWIETIGCRQPARSEKSVEFGFELDAPSGYAVRDVRQRHAFGRAIQRSVFGAERLVEHPAVDQPIAILDRVPVAVSARALIMEALLEVDDVEGVEEEAVQLEPSGGA